MTDPATRWSNPPRVPKNDFNDFADMAGDGPYEGMDLKTAKERFAENDLEWEETGPEEFKEIITNLGRSLEYSEAVGSACFAFCEDKIPKEYRLAWTIAIMAQRDKHEGD